MALRLRTRLPLPIAHLPPFAHPHCESKKPAAKDLCFGGERVCQNTQVRTDLVDLAVWQEVCTLLAHPERLAEEYRRRLQPEMSAKRLPLATVESQISQLR